MTNSAQGLKESEEQKVTRILEVDIFYFPKFHGKKYFQKTKTETELTILWKQKTSNSSTILSYVALMHQA